MKKSAIIAIFLCLSLLYCSQDKNKDIVQQLEPSIETKQSTITVKFVIGTILFRRNTTETPLLVGDSLQENDIVITGQKSSVDLVFNDEGIIRIAENSEFSIASLGAKQEDTNKMALNKGKIFVSVSKLKKGGIEVQTQTMVAAVRGTSFIVSTSEEKSTLQVIKGSVNVKPVHSQKIVASEQISTAEGKQVTILAEDTAKYEDDTKQLKTEPIRKTEVNNIGSFIEDISPESFPELKEEARIELQSDVPEKIEKLKDEAAVVPERQRSVSADIPEESAGIDEEMQKKEIERQKKELRKRKTEEAKENAVNIPSI